MKVKFLIVLPLILTVGILLGHLMQVLASAPGPVGHTASQTGGTTIDELTFNSPYEYFFRGVLSINSNLNRYAKLTFNSKNSANNGGADWKMYADADGSVVTGKNRWWGLWGYPKKTTDGSYYGYESFITAEFPTADDVSYTKRITLSANTKIEGNLELGNTKFADLCNANSWGAIKIITECVGTIPSSRVVRHFVCRATGASSYEWYQYYSYDYSDYWCLHTG